MKIEIISSSIRDKRNSHYVSLFIEKYIRDNTNLEVDVIDLKKLNLPLVKERFNNIESPEENLVEFQQRILKADAVIIVTPEYNGGYPASLKNAIDALYVEWKDKPVGLVSVTIGMFGGKSVYQQLSFIMYNIGCRLAKTTMFVPFVTKNFNEKGELISENEQIEKNLSFMLNDLEVLAKL